MQAAPDRCMDAARSARPSSGLPACHYCENVVHWQWLGYRRPGYCMLPNQQARFR